jgi:hypothetical protein
MEHFQEFAAHPICPKCQMRMITVPEPAPAQYECLRCSYSEPTSSVELP